MAKYRIDWVSLTANSTDQFKMLDCTNRRTLRPRIRLVIMLCGHVLCRKLIH